MAHHRHKRETNARRFPGTQLVHQLHRLQQHPRVQHLGGLRATVLAAPLAVVATVGVVSVGVVAADVHTVAEAGPSAVSSVGAGTAAGEIAVVPRRPTLSRDFTRRVDPDAVDKSADEPAAATKKAAAKAPTELERLLAPYATRKAIAGAETERWTTEPLNLWDGPTGSAAKTGEVDAGEQVLLTGREHAGRAEIVWQRTRTRWVTADYLTAEEPFTLGGDCTNGTSVPDGVSPNVKLVHEAVCGAFPDITTYGTFRGDGEHSQGLAVDIMVSGARGQEVADFVREYAADLNVSYVIYAQQIWSVERGGEGWRGMEDRGSVTANHFDHVHVTVF